MSNLNPFGDMTKMLEKFKVPGIDMTTIIEARRKDIEALAATNQAAMQAMQDMGRKQAEMLSAAMQEIQATSQSLAGSAGDSVKQTEIVKKAYAKALADAKDLAEMARKAQTDSMVHMVERANAHMAEIKKLMTPK